MFYWIQYLLFPGNDKKSVFFPNRLAATKRASIRGPRYRGKFGDIRAYVQTYKHILKRGLLFGRRQLRPQPELVGFAAIILWHDKPEAYFAKVQMHIGMSIVENN